MYSRAPPEPEPGSDVVVTVTGEPDGAATPGLTTGARAGLFHHRWCHRRPCHRSCQRLPSSVRLPRRSGREEDMRLPGRAGLGLPARREPRSPELPGVRTVPRVADSIPLEPAAVAA